MSRPDERRARSLRLPERRESDLSPRDASFAGLFSSSSASLPSSILLSFSPFFSRAWPLMFFIKLTLSAARASALLSTAPCLHNIVYNSPRAEFHFIPAAIVRRRRFPGPLLLSLLVSSLPHPRRGPLTCSTSREHRVPRASEQAQFRYLSSPCLFILLAIARASVSAFNSHFRRQIERYSEICF